MHNWLHEWLHDTESWGLALGFVAPLAIAVIQQPRWTARQRWAVGWLCAIIIGVLTCLANGTLDQGDTVLRTLIIVIVASQAAYAGWKRGPAPVIERATSPASARGRLG